MVMARGVKRTIDLVAAGLGLVVLAPLIAVVAALILLIDGRPVLFTQQRSGRAEEPFAFHKFRTMASGEGFDPTTDAKRITKLGAFLRATSLDELPNLWHVLMGDMSLVGPRPLPVHYLDRYSPHQRRRLEVRPGITGLAQVTGRNLLSWDERLSLDVDYVDGWSVRGDLAILVATIRLVVKREGIAADGAATMQEFRGSDRSVPRTSSGEPAT